MTPAVCGEPRSQCLEARPECVEFPSILYAEAGNFPTRTGDLMNETLLG